MAVGQKIGATLATKYGLVNNGKYVGCKIALGNDPSKKISVSNVFEQIIFIDGKEEKGRHDIAAEIKSLKPIKETKDGIEAVLTFTDVKTSDIFISQKELETGWVKFLKMFLNSSSNKGSAQTQYDVAKEKYHYICSFLTAFVSKYDSDDISWLRRFNTDHSLAIEALVKKFD